MMAPADARCWRLAIGFCRHVAAAHADCVLPPAPSKIPDGATASSAGNGHRDADDEGIQRRRRHLLKCLDFEAKQNHLSRAEEDKLHNTAVDALQKVAGKFNEQVRTFKSRTAEAARLRAICTRHPSDHRLITPTDRRSPRDCNLRRI